MNSDIARKALLVCTNRGSYPLYQALRTQGWSVAVTGTSNSGPLTKLCPNHVCANYANPGELAKIVKDKSYDAIVPGCTDASYLACSALESDRKYGFDSPDAVQQIFNKERLHKLSEELKISLPKSLSKIDALDTEAIIIKPVDSYSGSGITRIDRPTQSSLQAAIDAAETLSPSGRILIEEFIVGQLYSHSAFICNQEIRVDFFVKEDCVDNPFAVDTSCIADDLPLNSQVQIRQDVERLAKRLHLKDGLVHTQFIVRDGRTYLLEMTRRHPGDLYGLLIQHSTGFDYTVNYLNAFLPKPIEPRKTLGKPSLIIRHTITAGAGIDLWSLQFNTPVLIREWVPLATAGDKLSQAPKGRAAIIFLEANDQQMQADLYQRLRDRELYTFVGHRPDQAENSQNIVTQSKSKEGK